MLAKIKVMTFNLRFDTERDGDNAWEHRRELVVDLIRECAPDILGTQEGTPRQLDYLMESLPEYRMVAEGRVWDATCQYPTLFVVDRRWGILDAGEFWLSLSPSEHRSKSWDSAFPRMMSHALLEERESGWSVLAAVTHLDHLGARARVEQALMIAEWFQDRSAYARILLGDFNDLPLSPVHSVLVNPGTGLVDTWQELGREENEASMTHHDFSGVPKKCRMDWILISRDWCVVDAAIVRTNRRGRYPSDHFPYLAVLERAHG